MKTRALIGLIFASILLTACGSTSSVKQALPVSASGTATYQIADITSSVDEVPAKFRKDLRKYLEKDLKKRGMLGSGKNARKVSVTITDFSMSKGAARVLFGSFAGKDFVKASVNVVDSGNKLIGSTTIESTDHLAGGGPELFTSNHAKAIAKFLRGKS